MAIILTFGMTFMLIIGCLSQPVKITCNRFAPEAKLRGCRTGAATFLSKSSATTRCDVCEQVEQLENPSNGKNCWRFTDEEYPRTACINVTTKDAREMQVIALHGEFLEICQKLYIDSVKNIFIF